MRDPQEMPGFTARPDLGHKRRTAAFAEWVATIGLAIGTLVAATAFSVGFARANVAGAVIDNEGGLFTVALLLGVIFIGMGGLTVFHLPHRQKKH
jgi:hypothetical protein